MSLVQRVHAILLEGLDEGRFRPGDRVKAAELANRLGVSRGPVREALHVLAGQGILELLPDKGAVMRQLNIEDLIQIYEVSGAVARVAVVEAARRIDEGDNAERVRAAFDRILASADEPPSFQFYLVLNDLHYVLNDIAQKPYVDFVLGMMNLEYWNRFLAEAIDLTRYKAGYIANYTRLVDAILAGDWRAAEAIMTTHVEWSISLLRERQT